MEGNIETAFKRSGLFDFISKAEKKARIIKIDSFLLQDENKSRFKNIFYEFFEHFEELPKTTTKAIELPL